MTTTNKWEQPDKVDFSAVFSVMITNAIAAYCLLREMVQNGFDANLRYAEEVLLKDPGELYRPATSKVIVTRWGFDPNKLAVINVHGSFMTPSDVRNHLLKVGNSHSGNLGENFGIGVKFACFAHFHHVEFRSKKANSTTGMKYRIDGSPAGQGKFLPEKIPLGDFDRLGYEDSGTEVIILGKDPKTSKTYDELHNLFLSYKNQATKHGSGNNFYKYLCNRYHKPFTDSAGNEVVLEVDQYSRMKPVGTKACNSYFAKNVSQWKHADWKHFEFALTVGDYKGAPVTATILPGDQSGGKLSNVRTRGSLLLHKDNEVYDRFSPGSENDHATKVKPYLRECGLSGIDETQALRWCWLVDLQQFENVYPQGDRLALLDRNKTNQEVNLTQLAKDIAASLSDEVKKEINSQQAPPESFDAYLDRLQQEMIDAYNYEKSGDGERGERTGETSETEDKDSDREQSPVSSEVVGENKNKKRRYNLRPFDFMPINDGAGPLRKVMAKAPVSGKTTVFLNVESTYHSFHLKTTESTLHKAALKNTTLATALAGLTPTTIRQCAFDAIKEYTLITTLSKFLTEHQVTKKAGEDCIAELTSERLGRNIDVDKVAKRAAERAKYYAKTGLSVD